MEGQWSRGVSALTAVIMGSVPLASLPPICIVMLILWLIMNLDHQILPLLESVSSTLWHWSIPPSDTFDECYISLVPPRLTSTNLVLLVLGVLLSCSATAGVCVVFIVVKLKAITGIITNYDHSVNNS